MANNLTSNVTTKVLSAFIEAYEKNRVLTKTINTQMYAGKFSSEYGSTIKAKRPHRYRSIQTSGGDISSSTKNVLDSGSMVCTVQNYITVAVEWENIEEALHLNQLDEILSPMAMEAVTTLESNMGDFMIKNAALAYGGPDTPVDAWSDVVGARALMNAIGVPMGDQYYVMNDFTVAALADAQNGLSASDSLVKSAWETAQISQKFAGLKAMTSNSLSTYTSGGATDRAGALAATPTATYVGAKDSMQQTLSVTGLTVSVTGAIKAGDILEFPGTGSLARSYIHQLTRKTAFKSGAPIPWRCTALADMDTDGSGEGSVLVSGAAIYETDGQYNNISAALASGDVFNILGTKDKEYQPNLFYAKNAFTLAYIKLPKLYATDTVSKATDGVTMRATKYADGDANTQKLRIDLLPAFGCADPFFAGKGYGL